MGIMPAINRMDVIVSLGFAICGEYVENFRRGKGSYFLIDFGSSSKVFSLELLSFTFGQCGGHSGPFIWARVRIPPQRPVFLLATSKLNFRIFGFTWHFRF